MLSRPNINSNNRTAINQPIIQNEIEINKIHLIKNSKFLLSEAQAKAFLLSIELQNKCLKPVKEADPEPEEERRMDIENERYNEEHEEEIGEAHERIREWEEGRTRGKNLEKKTKNQFSIVK